MKACVLNGIGQLDYMEIEKPIPEKDEVLLKVKACGICSSDVPRIFKTGTYHFPTIPGHEFAGEIVETGAEVDAGLMGRKAAVFPLKPCFKCDACKQQEYARCSNYDYYGSRCDGAYSEYIAVKAWNLVFYTDILDSYAALCEPASVALHALQRAGVTEENAASKSIAVIGTGTIGILCALWASALGSTKVIVVGRSEDRLTQISKIWKEICCENSSDEKYAEKLSAITGTDGADIVIEAVGTDASLESAILSAKRGGTIVLMGNPDGNKQLEKSIYWKLLRSEITLVGTWNSQYSQANNNWKSTIEAMESGKLKVEGLITHEFSLEDYDNALKVVMDREDLPIKVMLKP